MNPEPHCWLAPVAPACRGLDAEGALLFVVALALALAAWAAHLGVGVWKRRAVVRAWQAPPDDGGLYAAADRVVYRGPPVVDADGLRDYRTTPSAVVRRGEVLGNVGLVRGEFLTLVVWDDGAIAEVAQRHLGHESLYSKG